MSAATMRAPVSADAGELFLRRHGCWLLLLTAALLLLPGINSPLSDVDEARFTGATLEMIQRGEWVVPYFNGEYRFDKPPLTYWLQRASFAVFGVNEFAARFHSLVTTVGVALLIFSFGRRLFSASSGFIAAFAWLTCVQVQAHGRAAVADMPMIFCIILAHRALFELLLGNATSRRYGRWFWALYLALGIGFLAKGPVTFAVPVMTLLLHRFVLWRKPLAWKSLQPFAGFLICVSIIAAWGAPALIMTHGLFWKVGIGHHIIDRGSNSFWLKSNPFFYLASVFLSLLPWTACAVHGVLSLRQFWNRENSFLLAWLLAPCLIFSFYATQIPHYVMPAFPAIFLLMFHRPWPVTSPASWEKFWFWGVLALYGAAVTTIAVPLLRQPFAVEFDLMRIFALWFLGLILSLLLLAAGWRCRRLWWLLPGVMLSASCAIGFAPEFARVVPTVPLQNIFRQMPVETEYLGVGYSESTLVYYSHHVWKFADDWELLRQRLEAPGARCVVALRREFKFDLPMVRILMSGADTTHITPSTDNRQKLDLLAPDGYQRARISGLSLERASWVELEVFFRTTPQP